MFDSYRHTWNTLNHISSDVSTHAGQEHFCQVLNTAAPKTPEQKASFEVIKALWELDTNGFNTYVADKPYMYLLAGPAAIKETLKLQFDIVQSPNGEYRLASDKKKWGDSSESMPNDYPPRRHADDLAGRGRGRGRDDGRDDRPRDGRDNRRDDRPRDRPRDDRPRDDRPRDDRPRDDRPRDNRTQNVKGQPPKRNKEKYEPKKKQYTDTSPRSGVLEKPNDAFISSLAQAVANE